MSNIDRLKQGNLTPAVNYGKVALIVILIVSIGVAVAVGIILWLKAESSAETSERIEDIQSSYVPDGFFSTPKPERSNINITGNYSDMGVPMPRGEIADLHNSEKDAKTEKVETPAPAIKTITVKVPPLTTEEAFIKKQLSRIALIEQMRKERMISRKESVKSEGWDSSELIENLANSNKKDEFKDNDFAQHEMGKDVSTFPVDLTRTITADRYIPCVLNDQINSQLEGRATCTVERNVFGFHGRKILIPAGSRMIGNHGTLEKVGDERFNIAWTRLIRPDGVHVKLTDAYASDRIGSTGIEGVVNNRRFEKYGAAVLTATVSVLAQMSIPTEGNNITNSVIESYGTDLGQVTAAMLQETINIKPYSIVPAGTRINVTPVTDIWLKEANGALSFSVVEK